jgi:tetratricopeptide (TPR) repeat protein
LAFARLLFNSLALTLGLGLALAVLVLGLRPAPPPYLSLVEGRVLAEAGALPRTEAVVYTAPADQPFDARTWGYDLLAFLAVRSFGLGALRLGDAVALGLGLLGLAAAFFRRGARPFSTALCLVWLAWASLGDLSPGPLLWAWALACLCLGLLEGPFWEAFFGRWVWVAPLVVLWVNVHGSAWVLVPVLGIWLLFEGQGADPLRPQQAVLAKLGFFALLLVLLCLHPLGWRLPWLSWRSWGPSPLLPGVFEAHQSALLLLAFSLLALVASSWTAGGRASLGRDGALFVVAVLAALFSADALPLALVYCAPMAATRADQVVDALPSALRSLRWPLKAAVLGALLWSWLPHPGRSSWAARLPTAAAEAPLPQRVLKFYEQELLNVRLLCPPEWAGGVAWKLAPQVALALDQRGAAVAGRANTEALQEALRAEGPWRETLLGRQVEACLLPLGSPLAIALARALDWQPVAFDDLGVLYVRALPTQKELIRVQAPRGLRPGDPAQPFDPGRLSQAEADIEARLTHDPDLGVLYFYSAELWLAKEQPARARQALEAGVRADPTFAPNYLRLAALRQAAGQAGPAKAALERGLSLPLGPYWQQALARLGGA